MEDRLDKKIEKDKQDTGLFYLNYDDEDNINLQDREGLNDLLSKAFVLIGDKNILINDLVERKNNSIQLKNIDLSSVKPNEQMKKFNEEVEEFIIAVEEHNYMALKCKSHMIEEFWDVVQSGLGLLHFEGVEADEVMQGYGKHLLKMEQRGNKPREGIK